MTVLMGVDENGLGPRLGPLVVTAVTVRCEDESAVKIASGRPGRTFTRLGDSKDLVAHGDTSLGEAWARALLERIRTATPATPPTPATPATATATAAPALATPDDLFHALCIDTRDTLRARCPGTHGTQCWGAKGETFGAEPKLFDSVRRDLGRLEKRGISIVRVEVVVVCAERLNAAIDRGQSRFVVDLHSMERLVLSAREAAGEDLVATCGKVGGYDRYGDAFGPLSARLHAVVEEGRARSEYQFPGVGRVAFVRDADAGHLVVGMASLVGKWVRDLLMDRVVRYHQAVDPELPAASGYHDPVTTRFISQSALLRSQRGLPDVCFERGALGGASSSASAPTSSRRPPAKKPRPASQTKLTS
jgi:ribonuclease HII